MKIKICGIKSAYEAMEVAKLDVDFLGVIFAPSTRQVTLQTAAIISQIAHQHGKKCVGVFGDLNDQEIASKCKNANLDIVQIYGNYSLELKAHLMAKFVEVWKVYRVDKTLPNIEKGLCSMPLFDYKGEKLGGNSKSFDWELLRGLEPNSFVLAGGIGKDNAKEAASYRPYAIDINSKVEGSDGLKDTRLIKEIIDIVKDER